MTTKTKYQQQVLFEEKELTADKLNSLEGKTQVIFDNEDWSPIDEKLAFNDITPEEKRKPKWLWRLFFIALTCLVGIELVDFFVTGFTESPITTSLFAIVFVCVGVISGSVLFREIVGLKQLKKRDGLRTEVIAVIDQTSDKNAMTLCDQITDSLPCDLTAEIETTWKSSQNADLTNPEIMQIYSRVVLSEVDKKALAEVAKFSSESVVLVALSPAAFLDMLIMLWRNLTLIDKVAGLYGLKLGYWSRISLLKQVIVNIVYAGASEVLVDVSTDMIGADILGKLSGRLAQGLGAGMLTARLGIKAIHLCRPMPFDENAPRIAHVRKEIVKQLKALL